MEIRKKMTSPYYIVKLFHKTSPEKPSSSLNENGKACEPSTQTAQPSGVRQNLNKDVKTCRICLKHGNIPIYSENNSKISLAVRDFGDIDINEDDEYPKQLCETCHNLLQGAILFRQKAQKSSLLLKKVKTLHNLVSEDSQSAQSLNKQRVRKIVEKKPQQNKTYSYIYVTDSDDQSGNDKESTGNQNEKAKSNSGESDTTKDKRIAKYVCDICGKSFYWSRSYRYHRQIHKDGFPYECDHCPYKAKYIDLLKTHMRTHNRENMHKCPKCPMKFLTKCNLNRHSLKHKERTFHCDICTKSFHFEHLLQCHIKADHLGIKNHVCDTCGKAFGYRKAMLRHQLAVHKRPKKTPGRTPAYIKAELEEQSE